MARIAQRTLDLPLAHPVPPTHLLGAETVAPCLDGRSRRCVNLDYAASTPVMAAVWDAVEAFVPWYSSVHRGSGLKSRVSTDAFEGARDSVAAFVGARAGDAVVFVRNTTEAVNVLSAALPAGARVLSSPVEHHSNMLPWRRHELQLLPFTDSADELLDACRRALEAARPRIDLVAVTGASNVTGEVWPLAELAAIAHAHGAQLFADAAQLAPHRPVDMARTGIDFLALSGHKLYAPFGTGALVGDARRLGERPPLLCGGGAIELVTPDEVIWAGAPERHEAGSPNVIGAVALAAACTALLELGMDTVAAHEQALSARLWSGLATVPGLQPLRLWPGDADRVGVATFNLDGYRHPLLAAVLSAEHAIAVRHGCFCAHLLIARLLGIPERELDRLTAELHAGRHPALPGAVRASLGLGTTAGDVDQLIDALQDIAATGPRGRYLRSAGGDEYHLRRGASAMTGIVPVLGVLAAAVGVADTIPYVRDILRGRTRPHRGTWLIWGVLAFVVCLSQRADGASWSLVMAATQVVLTTGIFVLAIRLGTGGVSVVDILMIGVACAGVAGWLVADQPIVATLCVVGADLIAAALMVPKTHRDPHSETLSTFVLASLGGALAAGAVGVIDVSLLLYPIYYCLVNGAIALLIARRRYALRPALAVVRPFPARVHGQELL